MTTNFVGGNPTKHECAEGNRPPSSASPNTASLTARLTPDCSLRAVRRDWLLVPVIPKGKLHNLIHDN
ncbi:hypothetical protein KIN20_033596 [Parelaphostrongylus tenuis]|uniref:Uncharacterized protein n=1 Tax=Parelaphostrongylus tenuis TaxID=148309 RepID=A0AAD5R8X1_PARTN|nr:hypothetical protein KIN20_033596 [Parelaphostrongylus tenuis]